MRPQTSTTRSVTQLLCASALALILLVVGEATVDATVEHDTGFRSHQPAEMLYSWPKSRGPLHPFRTLMGRLVNRACEQGILPVPLCASDTEDRDFWLCPEPTAPDPQNKRSRALA